MANALRNPALWVDNWDAIGPPPDYWNGTTYARSTGAEVFTGLVLKCVGAVGGNDVFAGEITATDASGDLLHLNLLDASQVIVDFVPVEQGVPTSFSFPAAQNYSVALSGAPLGTAGFYLLDFTITPADDPVEISYNCECDDDYPRTTLADLRKRVIRRLGFSAQADNPPPGMAELVDDFINEAQDWLYREYAVFRMERFFTWPMEAGVRFYDLDENSDTCERKLDPRAVTWVGISQGEETWHPLRCGINPVLYSGNQSGIPSRYEIRQCIELWPAPDDDSWQLRVKGLFPPSKMTQDGHFTSIDEQPIFYLALANAKAHYGQPDAERYTSMMQAYVTKLVAGSHHTRRYRHGSAIEFVEPQPVWTETWPPA